MAGRWRRITVTTASAGLVLPGAGLAGQADLSPVASYSSVQCSAGAHTLAPPGSHLYPETGNGGYSSVHTLVHLVYDPATNEFLPGNRVVLRATDRVDLRRLVRGGVGVVLPVRVARVRGLDEREAGRLAVHGDRLHGHVRPRLGVRGLALEIEAEAAQALGGLIGEHDPVTGQELVGGGVVDQVHQGVHAGVTAIAGFRVQVGARRCEGVRASRALDAAIRNDRAHGSLGRQPGPRQDQPRARRRDRDHPPAPGHGALPLGQHRCYVPNVPSLPRRRSRAMG